MKYKKGAFLFHPNKSKFASTEGAFELVLVAWNGHKKSVKRFQSSNSHPSKTSSALRTSSNGFYQYAANNIAAN
ncbi:hypothetical protein KSP39_PZI000590 [Platanthera zijinensis]|uniref:Uncharacterized protein n=1 Tax=Platanthera zijinensis TaxID=2320716 RepID=A0AAP0GEY3_9ASPA